MNCHSMVTRDFSRVHLLRQEESNITSSDGQKPLFPTPPIVSNLQFLMRAVICKEFVPQDQTIKVGFPEI